MEPVSNNLPAIVVERLHRVARISGPTGCKRYRSRHAHIDAVFNEVSAAIVKGDAAALERAWQALELLSLELCEE